jgi:hypothetical protein
VLVGPRESASEETRTGAVKASLHRDGALGWILLRNAVRRLGNSYPSFISSLWLTFYPRDGEVSMSTAKELLRGRPTQPRAAEERECELRVNVVFTRIEQTLAALRTAARLAADLRARLVVWVPQVVPYPAPIDSASVPRAFLVRRLLTVANESRIETRIRVCVCRDRRTVLSGALPPRSIVVIGGSKRWWPTQEQRLAAELWRQGHHVVFVEWK